AVLDRVPDARLTLVGEGSPGDPTAAELRETLAGDPRLAESVTITGWVDDVLPFLERADVFVFPSHFEGLSNSLLEACALGRVIVASDIPANRAAVGDDHPLLFPHDRADELERALLAAMTDEPIRASARARGLERSR